jgi:hypothetical protein
MTGVIVRPGGVRASDAERDRCQRALARAFAEGRLEADELERRMDGATAALTRADLRALTSDLPARRSKGIWRLNARLLRAHTATWLALNGGLVGIWAASGQGDFWPGAVVAGTSTVLAWHAGITWALRRPRRGRGDRARLDKPRARI